MDNHQNLERILCRSVVYCNLFYAPYIDSGFIELIGYIVLKTTVSVTALALGLTLGATAIANTNGEVRPHPSYPECNYYPILNSEGEALYWNFVGYCKRAACAADPDDC